MGNGFFDDHSLLGGMFDFDNDGSLDIDEAAIICDLGAIFLGNEDGDHNSFYDDDDDDISGDDWDL